MLELVLIWKGGIGFLGENYVNFDLFLVLVLGFRLFFWDFDFGGWILLVFRVDFIIGNVMVGYLSFCDIF